MTKKKKPTRAPVKKAKKPGKKKRTRNPAKKKTKRAGKRTSTSEGQRKTLKLSGKKRTHRRPISRAASTARRRKLNPRTPARQMKSSAAESESQEAKKQKKIDALLVRVYTYAAQELKSLEERQRREHQAANADSIENYAKARKAIMRALQKWEKNQQKP